jgi:hypothetical protein
MPVEAEARVGSPIGEFSWFCIFCCAAVNDADLDVGYIGAHEDDTADAGLCQVVQGQPSAGVMDGDDEQIIQCLEHVWVRLSFLSFPFFLYMASRHDHLRLYKPTL